MASWVEGFTGEPVSLSQERSRSRVTATIRAVIYNRTDLEVNAFMSGRY